MITPLHDAIVGDVRPSLLVMLGAVGLVLVIACVNLANLLIVRAIGQGREVAIRMAIGASRAQITIDLALRGLILGVFGRRRRPVVRRVDAQPARVAGADHHAADGRPRAQPARAGRHVRPRGDHRDRGGAAACRPALARRRGSHAARERADDVGRALGRAMARPADGGGDRGGADAGRRCRSAGAKPDAPRGRGSRIRGAGRAPLHRESTGHEVSRRGGARGALRGDRAPRRVDPGRRVGRGRQRVPAARRRAEPRDHRGRRGDWRRQRPPRGLPGGEPRLLRHAADSAPARPVAGRPGSRRRAAGRGRQRDVRAPLPGRP